VHEAKRKVVIQVPAWPDGPFRTPKKAGEFQALVDSLEPKPLLDSHKHLAKLGRGVIQELTAN
jgi:hypothetical protein